MNECEVDMLDFNTYESRLFTVFNNAILHSMDTQNFRNQTPEESFNDMVYQIEEAHKKGYSF
jgi:hypothetical protein